MAESYLSGQKEQVTQSYTVKTYNGTWNSSGQNVIGIIQQMKNTPVIGQNVFVQINNYTLTTGQQSYGYTEASDNFQYSVDSNRNLSIKFDSQVANAQVSKVNFTVYVID